MQLYNIKDIVKTVDCQLIGSTNNVFDKIIIDSRKIVYYKNCLFFAFVGKQHDGHKFIDELYKKGVRSFVISKDVDVTKYPQASFIKVKDSLIALHQIAYTKSLSYNNTLVSITGSNGKTIVKEWLYHLLSEQLKISKSPKSYNSQLGVPLSILMLDKESDLAIIEAGISKPGEMEKLEKIINPQIGILTNIGEAHQSNFKNIEEKINEKLKLFKRCKTVICNYEFKKYLDKKNTLTWSCKNKNADIFNIKNIVSNDQTSIKLKYKEEIYTINIPFTDTGSISNAITCFCYICLQSFQTDDKIINRFSNLPVIRMRLETLEAINNSILINDSYNSDLNSLEIAIDYLLQKKGNKETCLIMSDIIENTSKTDELYKEISNLVKNKHIDNFIGIGEQLCKHKDLFKTQSQFYLDTKSFINEINFSKFISKAILLKGARDFRFELISKRLQLKTHESYLETDLNIMRDNLLYFKSLLKPSTKIMAMVKAYSYGSGYREIASFLQHNRIDYLTVAYTDEGVELRNYGIKTPIMVMNPSSRDFNKMIEYKLEPEIYSLKLFKKFDKELKNINITDFSVHIKLNTGMNRLGINDNELSELCDLIKSSPKIKVKSIFSHLAGSDDRNLDYFTKEQIDIFEKSYSQIVNSTGIKPERHILNSSGIYRFPNYQYEMVRLGIGLYGLIPELQKNINQISTFKSVISQIRNVKKEDTIGYNRFGKITKNSKIATIPVGYADGIDRRLGNGKWYFMINGQKAYTIGNICMDMCMVDVSEIKANENDEVIIFGADNDIISMAKILNTIPYEIITGISERVKRIYIEE